MCSAVNEQLLFLFASLFHLQHKPASRLSSIKDLRSVSTIVPIYNETVWYSVEELKATSNTSQQQQQPHLSLIEFLVEKHKHEWNNFASRLKYSRCVLNTSSIDDGMTQQSRALLDDFLKGSCAHDVDIVEWSSYRGQTLARTIRGLTHTLHALKLLAEYELTFDNMKELDMFIHSKYQIIIAAQIFGDRSQSQHRQQLRKLMQVFPHVHIVYNYDYIHDMKCRVNIRADMDR